MFFSPTQSVVKHLLASTLHFKRRFLGLVQAKLFPPTQNRRRVPAEYTTVHTTHHMYITITHLQFFHQQFVCSTYFSLLSSSSNNTGRSRRENLWRNNELCVREKKKKKKKTKYVLVYTYEYTSNVSTEL